MAEEGQEEAAPSLSELFAAIEDDEPKLRIAGIYGEIDEQRSADLISALLLLKESGKREKLKNPNDPECTETVLSYDPIEFIVSTNGGSAPDMFAIYDVMRMVRENCSIRTLGIGKVMSAGVLLLASGTKGERRIGKNCRVMIHSVVSAQHGQMHDILNEVGEAKWVQRRYIKVLADETSMTEKQIKSFFRKKINVYLGAEEAVKLGIADIII